MRLGDAGGAAAGKNPGPPEGWEAPRQRRLSTLGRPAFGPRSVLLEVVTRLLFPAILMFSVYLLLAGHDRPGGGFSGGLVASMAYVLRYVAGGRHELAAAMPVEPRVLLATGLLLASAMAVAPLPRGGPILETFAWEFTLPVFGEVKLLSMLIFEVGVFLIVVGLVLAVVATLGARMEVEEEEAREVRRKVALRDPEHPGEGGLR